jgi:hypothetical protein
MRCRREISKTATRQAKLVPNVLKKQDINDKTNGDTTSTSNTTNIDLNFNTDLETDAPHVIISTNPDLRTPNTNDIWVKTNRGAKETLNEIDQNSIGLKMQSAEQLGSPNKTDVAHNHNQLSRRLINPAPVQSSIFNIPLRQKRRQTLNEKTQKFKTENRNPRQNAPIYRSFCSAGRERWCLGTICPEKCDTNCRSERCRHCFLRCTQLIDQVTTNMSPLQPTAKTKNFQSSKSAKIK